MKKEIKAYIDEKYKGIYSDVNISWLKGLKKKKEEIKHNGLANSGIEQKILIDYAFSLIYESNIKVKELIEKSQEKFNFKMPKKEIEKYINKSIENNISYLDKFEKELLEYFEDKKTPLVESCKIQFRNVRLNNTTELEKIKKEIILTNKRQKKKQWHFNKSDIIGIISIIVAILLFILGLILA